MRPNQSNAHLAIECVGVSRVYPGPPPVPALRRADLAIPNGEYVAIVGRSGSGKSTLLNLLGLLDRPTEGRYWLDGIEVGSLADRDRTALRGGRIGFVFQSFQLLPHRSALENVMLSLVYNATPARQRRELAAQALNQVGLGHRKNALPTTLSGGEQQRVAIARALVKRPTMLLCDEPTGSLDSASALTVLELFDDLHAAGLTIVTITHAAEVAARAERTMVITDGILSEHGTASEHGIPSERSEDVSTAA